MSIKLFFALLAPIVSIIAFVPYFSGIFAGTTRPHLYTWLIWTLSTGIGTAGLWYGGGGWAAVSGTVGATLTFFCFLFCFKYGTKDITVSDTIVLVLSLCAVGLWLFLHQPLLAVILASLIDLSGYISTYRKSWVDPWSESLTSWLIWIGYGFCIILALQNYNWLTLPFILSTTVVANLVLIALLLLRRRVVPKPFL